MKFKAILIVLVITASSALMAQSQSWQWVKAGGSSSDNASSANSAECRISGCDAKGNVYAVGAVNGPNMIFDTFSCSGTYPNIVGSPYPGSDILFFSYDCSGNMRWAEHIGDEENQSTFYGAVTDVYGYTYIAHSFSYGVSGSGPLPLFLGDSVLIPPSQVVPQLYMCIIKYDSLGKLVWFKNYEEDTAFGPHSGLSAAYGLRIGSSGNLWMACVLDSNYAISPNLHTTKYGKYNVEVNPTNGNILGGYYIAQVEFFGDGNNPNVNYDIDEHENYYENGNVVYDTLRLLQQNFAPNLNNTDILPFIFSLDKHGNFRYIITDTANPSATQFGPCKYDFEAHHLTACLSLDTVAIFSKDTFAFSTTNFPPFYISSAGILSIDTSGNVLWCKYVTASNSSLGPFQNIPTARYVSGELVDGSFTYNNAVTITEGTDSCSSNCTDFYRNVMQINADGNYITSYSAHLGTVNQNVYAESARSGATDWRGNLYLGGSITNYMQTPVGTVTNTDLASGNFFIAKIGISDCSCPTPGVQFTQTYSGGSVNFYGSSINYSDSIHWEFGDGTTGTSDTMAHIYSHNGTYNVTAIAYSGCGVDSLTKQIIVTSVGIKTIEPGETKLYPNPVLNSVALEVSGPATIGLILANGASVWNSPVQIAQQGTYVFDMSKYSSAIYYFIVQYTNGKTDVMQLVKE